MQNPIILTESHFFSNILQTNSIHGLNCSPGLAIHSIGLVHLTQGQFLLGHDFGLLQFLLQTQIDVLGFQLRILQSQLRDFVQLGLELNLEIKKKIKFECLLIPKHLLSEFTSPLCCLQLQFQLENFPLELIELLLLLLLGLVEFLWLFCVVFPWADFHLLAVVSGTNGC